jgi:hypothetical protein
LKNWGILFLAILLSLGVVILSDQIIGLKPSMSLRNIVSPFQEMSLPEYVILIILLSMMFVPPIVTFAVNLFKQRR